MLKSLLKFELKFHTQQISFYLIAFASVFFGIIGSRGQMFDSDILVTGPFATTRMFAFIILGIPLGAMMIVVPALLRDKMSRMSEIIFTTPQKQWDYLASRMLGTVLVSSILFALVIIGMILGLIIPGIPLKPEDSISITNFLWPFLVLIIPAIIFYTSVLSAVAIYSQSSIAVYIAGAVLFFLYQIIAVYSGSPVMANPYPASESTRFIASVFDPTGLSSFFYQVRNWSVEQRNSELFSLSGPLLFNRALILTLSVAIFWYCLKQFKFKLNQGGKQKKVQASDETFDHVPYRSVMPVTGVQASWAAFKSCFKLEFTASIKTWSFAAILIFWLIIVITETLSGFARVDSTEVPFASTSVAIWRYAYDVIPRFGVMFLIFFAAEMFWREREQNINAFTDASPVSNVSLFMARLLALFLIPLTLITMAIGASSILQLIHGGEIQWSVYLSLYWMNGIPLMCFACLCLFINCISPNKYAAMVICAAVFILPALPINEAIGIGHPMFRFSEAPLSFHSEINGFSALMPAFIGYMSFWISLSLVLVLLGYGLFPRGFIVSLKYRLSVIKDQWGNTGKMLLMFAVVFSFISGQHLYQKIAEAGYQTRDDNLGWRKGYEQTYIQFKDQATPKVERVKNQVDLYPSQRHLVVEGEYTLVNHNSTPISEILVSTSRFINYEYVKLDEASKIEYDPTYSQYLIRLETPMQTGDKRLLRFKYNKTEQGYMGTPMDNVITEDFSYHRSIRYSPLVGFNKYNTIMRNSVRAKNGLPLLKDATAPEDVTSRNPDDHGQFRLWSRLETIVSTEQGQIAVAPGKLLKTWSKDNREYFHFETQAPVRNNNYFISGRFESKQKTVDGITLNVLYKKGHDINVDHTLDAMADAMTYANKHFGRYPGSQFTLVETPRHLGLTGYAMTQTVLIGEHVGFTSDLQAANTFDHVYRRTVHEVAHQWWGYQIDPLEVKGASMLVESLAKYTELALIRQKYGQEYANHLVSYEHRRYFNGRGRASQHEVPMKHADAQHLIYSKASVVMNALINELGEKAINSALQDLVTFHSGQDNPPLTTDFINYLRKYSPKSKHPIISQWLERVVYDDYEVTEATAELNAEGGYWVKLKVAGKRFIEEGDGKVKDFFAPKQVDVGLYANNPLWLDLDDLESNKQKVISVAIDPDGMTVEFVAEEKPSYVSIDPNWLTLDRNRENNVLKVDIKDQ